MAGTGAGGREISTLRPPPPLLSGSLSSCPPDTGLGLEPLEPKWLEPKWSLSLFLSWGHGGKPPGVLARPGIRGASGLVVRK